MPPLKAHETVLLRATFTLKRYQTILEARACKIDSFRDEYKYDVLQLDCPKCRALDGTIINGADALIFPSDDCICDTANYSLQIYVDFLAGWND